ncbi:BSP-domain-containing protein [Annulohypoxylon nitens]|nr:BSP-domain-containing protein [Annulohypoxylon nitens]
MSRTADPSSIPSLTDNLHIHLTISQNQDQDRKLTHSTMAIPPETTPVPPSVFAPGVTPRTDEPKPEPTALPIRLKNEPASDEARDEEEELTKSVEIPRLRLHAEDLSAPGSVVFLSSVVAPTVIESGIRSIHKLLYGFPFSSSSSPSPSSTATTTSPSSFPPSFPTHPPKPRSITLILRHMPGVAHTTGSDLDDEHKEIHFSLEYLASIHPPLTRTPEISGVLFHELVHCYQYNARGSAPGGLIEGIADWVRLRSDLAPPHWNRDRVPGRWDAGYDATAFFLEYLEQRFGEGTVRQLNEKLRKEVYEEKLFWTELVGRPVEQLFEDYKETFLKRCDEEGNDDEGNDEEEDYLDEYYSEEEDSILNTIQRKSIQRKKIRTAPDQTGLAGR